MKKIMITVAAVLLVGSVNAQTIYDATKFAGKDLNGTARFVGMGGAMGALGGDISTIGTNPAGIGIYRSNDLMTSFSFSAFGMESKYVSDHDRTYNTKMDKNHWTYDNLGFVFSSKIGNQTPIRYVNFGFNYHKSKSLYKNMGMDGLLNSAPNGGIVTQTYQMANQANGESIEKYRSQAAFGNPDLGWLSILGIQGYLVNQDNSDPDKPNMYMPATTDIPNALFRSEERGGIDAYDFNVALNLNDRVYLGLTIGAYDVDYSKYSSYDESYTPETGYLLESWNKISGSGFDFKLGAIVRPFESSPFRIGASVHSPTFYKLTLTTSALLTSDMFLGDRLEHTTIDTYRRVGDMNREFSLRTPWTYNLSLGYTVGSSFAIGAEYEYEDYSTMKFYYPEGDVMPFETEQTAMLKGVNTFRIGAEYKVIPQFAFRLGYNHSTSAFKENAFKNLPVNSINTDTDFANTHALNNYTLGLGYRGSMFYADLAYQFSSYKEDFYAFEDIYLNKTDVTNTRSQVLLTFGVRF